MTLKKTGRYVFRRDSKQDTDSDSLISSGRLFQSLGALTAKLCSFQAGLRKRQNNPCTKVSNYAKVHKGLKKVHNLIWNQVMKGLKINQ